MGDGQPHGRDDALCNKDGARGGEAAQLWERGGHQRSSEVIRGDPRPLEAIRGRPTSSEALRSYVAHRSQPNEAEEVGHREGGFVRHLALELGSVSG